MNSACVTCVRRLCLGVQMLILTVAMRFRMERWLLPIVN
jgi:hypothetical protein